MAKVTSSKCVDKSKAMGYYHRYLIYTLDIYGYYSFEIISEQNVLHFAKYPHTTKDLKNRKIYFFDSSTKLIETKKTIPPAYFFLPNNLAC